MAWHNRKTGLLHALAQLPKHPRSSLRDLRALFSGDKTRTLLYEQVERDRLRLQQKINSLSGQLNDLMTVELPGAEETFRILRRLVNDGCTGHLCLCRRYLNFSKLSRQEMIAAFQKATVVLT